MSQGLIDLSSVTVREEKSQNTSNCSFFPLLPPFFSPQSFFHHPLQVCDRLQTGWGGENNVLWPSVLPSSSVPGSNSLSQQAVGGLATAPPSASLSTPSTTTTTTTRINRSTTPYKRSMEVHASQYSAPPTMTSHVAQDWERGSKNKMESYHG